MSLPTLLNVFEKMYRHFPKDVMSFLGNTPN